ncbi:MULTISPECIES: glucose-1-phosphate thymidylyltransferase [unclassified Streptomyces]|uniref:glucose-1-phosphate thymidylyltransferase n=1 Tax=unclassified Streptomyces TaxID=2593676 RepID=UPI002DDB6007|nr:MULTISPECIES: glucose-1-phosphate thymidylyltransferase [unclassified Streptomyces]WSA95912.1 glucose-1-phosphate thymidylyltransferase [Streptomyces sp. NBC_01795]WSB80327.1 glucose-1-phosphate thymidylyltransferase [Streptomyces sp. NBC_01775]WSS11462.1 glucose-1-phosphate thymidylyltransferase [Streptomyces sp. NBC_01186]WSS40176.1 glucose-1-phosphate thymidylyltransferase [Streptomyces sp. NBC_01187]
MKALVLAGGHGTRLRPFSHSTPKQLVPVANRPVLFHALDALRAAGVTHTCLIVAGHGGPIREAVGDGSDFGMAVDFLSQDAPRGLAHCVLLARPFLGDDDFVMYLGDNVFADGIAPHLAAFHADSPAAQLVVSKVEDPSQYGIAELDETGRVTALWEKPSDPRGDMAVTGAYVFTSAIHEAVAAIGPSARGELEITDAVQWLVGQGHTVRAKPYTGYWKDTGTLADLLDCNRVLLAGLGSRLSGTVDADSRLSGPVVVEEGAVVRRSRVEGPAVIGAGTLVEDSHVAPYTALGPGCRLRGAGVGDSILMAGASVEGIRDLRGSIIGKSGEVRRGTREAAPHRLLIGDDSRIEITA